MLPCMPEGGDSSSEPADDEEGFIPVTKHAQQVSLTMLAAAGGRGLCPY